MSDTEKHLYGTQVEQLKKEIEKLKAENAALAKSYAYSQFKEKELDELVAKHGAFDQGVEVDTVEWLRLTLEHYEELKSWDVRRVFSLLKDSGLDGLSHEDGWTLMETTVADELRGRKRDE